MSGPFFAAAAAKTFAYPSPQEIASTLTVTFGLASSNALPAAFITAASASPPVAQIVSVCLAALAGAINATPATIEIATAIAPKRFTCDSFFEAQTDFAAPCG